MAIEIRYNLRNMCKTAYFTFIDSKLVMYKNSVTLILYHVYYFCCLSSYYGNRIYSVMVRVLGSSAIGHGFEPCLGQTTDYKIGICCFSAKHAALRRKSKEWVGSESEQCVRVERHVFPRTVVSVR